MKIRLRLRGGRDASVLTSRRDQIIQDIRGDLFTGLRAT